MSQDGASSVCEVHGNYAPRGQQDCAEDRSGCARSRGRLLSGQNHENRGRAVLTAIPPQHPPLQSAPPTTTFAFSPPPPYRPLPQLIAGLIQAAGRPACKRALTVLGPQINYILHGNPLAEPHDYADPKYVGCEARHCMTADDLRKIDDGRAAEWTAAQSSKFTAKVAPISATRPRPRPDLALTLSLSPPAYAYHTFARTPSLYPPPPPPRRGANLSPKRYRYEQDMEERAGSTFQRRSISRYSGAGEVTVGKERSPEVPPLGCARSESCSAQCLPCVLQSHFQDRQAGRPRGQGQAEAQAGRHRQAGKQAGAGSTGTGTRQVK